jgi:hypothetical protein
MRSSLLVQAVAHTLNHDHESSMENKYGESFPLHLDSMQSPPVDQIGANPGIVARLAVSRLQRFVESN